MGYRTSRFLKGLGKELDPKDPFIKKTGHRGIDNFYSGYEVGGKGKLAIGAGALGIGGHSIYNAPEKALEQQAINDDVQSLPGTRGDMQGYVPQNMNPNEHLEAKGDLVFALHKLRHGD